MPSDVVESYEVFVCEGFVIQVLQDAVLYHTSIFLGGQYFFVFLTLLGPHTICPSPEVLLLLSGIDQRHSYAIMTIAYPSLWPRG
jgi:hypothetical protein